MLFRSPGQYFYDRIDDEVAGALDAARVQLEALGATAVQVDLPFADHIGGFGAAVSGVEALALHRAWLRERADEYGAQVIARYLTNVAVPAGDYLAMMQVRPRVITEFVNQVFSACDALLCPVFPFPLPTIAETDLADGAGYERLLASITCCTRPIKIGRAHV